MEKIKINVQSFVDIITNSSMEVYVMATESTISAAKELLSNLCGISLNEINKYFTFELVDDECKSAYNEYADIILEITTNVPEYEKYIKMLKNFMNSFNHDAEYNG